MTMEKLAQYKETIVFISCATVLVGTLAAVQKLTTPSRQRRSSSSSASHGAAKARSASRGPAGARSRSSSKVRSSHHTGSGHLNTTAGKDAAAQAVQPGSATNPVMAAGVAVMGAAAAAGAVRAHASRSRDASPTHAHRHHTHPQVAPTTATATERHVNGKETNNSRAAVSSASPPAIAKPLTVEAIAQHTRLLGTASALRSPVEPQEAEEGRSPLQRGVRVGGCTQAGGGGNGGDEGLPNHRSASNAATVGSQALYGASSASMGVGGVPAAVDAARNALQDAQGCSSESISCPPASPRVVIAAGKKQAPQLPTTVAAGTQTAAQRWFCTDRGTQTEREEEAALIDGLAGGTPDRWCHTAAMISPIAPAGEVSDTTALNCTDFGWTPERVNEGQTAPMERTAKPHSVEASPQHVPGFFLARVEAQVRVLLERVRHSDEHDKERAWMHVYVYLAELPLGVRAALAERDDCGVDAAFLSLADTAAHALQHELPSFEQSYEEPGNKLPPSPFSLPKAVCQLLQRGAPCESAAHFEWCDGACVLVEGPFVPTAPPELEGWQRASSLSLSPSPADKNKAHRDNNDDGDAVLAGMLGDVVAVAKHIEKYDYLIAKLTSSVRGSRGGNDPYTPAHVALAYGGRTPSPPTQDSRDARVTEPQDQHQLEEQQKALGELMESFVQLTRTPAFLALQQSPQASGVACDVALLAAKAQHLLTTRHAVSSSPSPDLSAVVQAPPTQKRVLASEQTDRQDTSVGTITSNHSESPNKSGHGGKARLPLKARTPMKPGIRYPVQRSMTTS